jgi:O-antigen/teichoic acid export membrane protein
MLDLLKKITRSTAIYSIGQIAPKVVGLVLLPFLTNEKYLSAADYGKLSILDASSAFLTTIFGFGLNYALERWYYDKKYIDSRKSIVFTLLSATFFLTALFWVILSLFSDQLSQLLTGRADWGKLLQLLFFCAAMESFILIPTTLLRLQEKPLKFISSNISRFFLYLALTLIFLVPMKMGLEGIYYARAISAAGILAVLFVYLFRNMTFRFEWQALREMIIFRLPLVLSSMSYIIFNITDRFSIRFLSDSTFKDVGVYSLGYSIVNSVKMVILSAIWLSLRPIIYQMMNDPGNKRVYSKIMKYMAFSVVFLLLCITTFGQEAILVLAKSKIYYESFYIIPIISVALIFDTLKEISQSISLNIIKKTGIIAITIIFATIINIGMNILLIPSLNIYGAALSNVISQFFFFIVIYFFSQRYYPVPYEIRRILTMVFVFIMLSLLALLTAKMDLLVRIPLKLMIIAVFPFILYYVNFFEAIEIARLKGMWKTMRNPADLIKKLSQE